jgi:hypothetical protein
MGGWHFCVSLKIIKMNKVKAVLSVKFNSTHGSAELVNLFKQDLDIFKNVPGLLEKYYITEETTGAKGGIYIFDSKKSRELFWTSQLAQEIPTLYGVKMDTLRVEEFEIDIDLNDNLAA